MTIIVPSRWLGDLVGESFLGQYPVEVHYNTIDTDIFRPTPGDFREKHGLKDKRIILGVAGVWTERKGLGDFLELRKLLDDRYAIVLVGLTEQQAAALPRDMIGITRTQNARELAQIYTAADVFLNPTYEDNLPTVNLEAESCGTPVIAYATGGCPETIHRPDSRIIPVGGYAQLPAILEAMFSNCEELP